MYLFKTAGNTFKSVIENQKHAFKNEPKDWYKGEIILVSKNIKDCKPTEKQIQYIMRLREIRRASEEEIERLWPGNKGRWKFIADCIDTEPISNPFNLNELLGDEAKLYSPVVTFKKIESYHEEIILRYIGLREIFLPEEIEPDTAFIEGAKKSITVNAYERDPKARQKCLKIHGYSCAICGFDFEKIYGNLGKKYIHVHHIVPLSSIKETYTVDPEKDLIPICPNCHAMIHRKREALLPEELKDIIRHNKKIN